MRIVIGGVLATVLLIAGSANAQNVIRLGEGSSASNVQERTQQIGRFGFGGYSGYGGGYSGYGGGYSGYGGGYSGYGGGYSGYGYGGGYPGYGGGYCGYGGYGGGYPGYGGYGGGYPGYGYGGGNSGYGGGYSGYGYGGGYPGYGYGYGGYGGGYPGYGGGYGGYGGGYPGYGGGYGGYGGGYPGYGGGYGGYGGGYGGYGGGYPGYGGRRLRSRCVLRQNCCQRRQRRRRLQDFSTEPNQCRGSADRDRSYPVSVRSNNQICQLHLPRLWRIGSIVPAMNAIPNDFAQLLWPPRESHEPSISLRTSGSSGCSRAAAGEHLALI